MYQLKCRKFMKIGEYEAMEFIDYNSYYKGQRPLKPKHVKMLENEMLNGTFLDGNIAIAILKYENNRKVLVNGQHQSQAVINTSSEIVVNYQEYDCFTPEDLSELFRRFDNHMQRSLSDCLNPEAAALGVEWKRRIVRLVVTAACHIEGIADMPKVEKVALLKRYLREGGFVNHLLKDGKSCQHMLRWAVTRAMIETWRINKDAALEFWMNVRDGANLEAHAPELELRSYLMGCYMTGSGKSGNSKARSRDIASAREVYVKCLHAWNAKRRGKKTDLKYYSSAPVPNIAG